MKHLVDWVTTAEPEAPHPSSSLPSVSWVTRAEPEAPCMAVVGVHTAFKHTYIYSPVYVLHTPATFSSSIELLIWYCFLNRVCYPPVRSMGFNVDHSKKIAIISEKRKKNWSINKIIIGLKYFVPGMHYSVHVRCRIMARKRNMLIRIQYNYQQVSPSILPTRAINV